MLLFLKDIFWTKLFGYNWSGQTSPSGPLITICNIFNLVLNLLRYSSLSQFCILENTRVSFCVFSEHKQFHPAYSANTNSFNLRFLQIRTVQICLKFYATLSNLRERTVPLHYLVKEHISFHVCPCLCPCTCLFGHGHGYGHGLKHRHRNGHGHSGSKNGYR